MTVKELIQNLEVYHPDLPLYGSVPISDYNFPISKAPVTEEPQREEEPEIVILFGTEKEKPLKVSEVISQLQALPQDDNVMLADGKIGEEDCLLFPAISLADLPPEGKCTKIVVCANLISGGED